jgi:predicted nucleotidyltransferase
VLDDEALQTLAARLVTVPGIVGVMLGGSRARGVETAGSDVDLGLYYRPEPNVEALGQLAREVAGPDAEVTRPGAWGPWVDGGGWLQIDGTPVDWIYRSLDRVASAWADAQAGRFAFHFQVGHPLGVPDFAYPGEVALGRILADPTGELTRLRDATLHYPPALRQKVESTVLWEADFALRIARKALSRADTAYVAGCLFRTVGLCAHALHASAGAWLISEKGAIQAAGALPGAPPGFAEAAHGVLARLGTTPDDLAAAIGRAGALVDATAACCAGRHDTNVASG